MEISAQTTELLLGLAALAMTIVAQYLRSKKNEAYEQGDVLLGTMKAQIAVLDSYAIFVPDAKPVLARMKELVIKFEMGWNDAKFTTDQVNALYAEFMGLAKEIAEIIKKYQG